MDTTTDNAVATPSGEVDPASATRWWQGHVGIRPPSARLGLELHRALGAVGSVMPYSTDVATIRNALRRYFPGAQVR